MKRLLTIGHSYVVGLNRQLAHQMAVAGRGRWDVTVAAPERYRGDLRSIALEPIAGEAGRLVALPMRLHGRPHLAWYGGAFRRLMTEPWDVVHCWEEPYVRAAAQIAGASPARARFVFSTFQNIPKRYPWPFSRFEQGVLARADGWIAFGRTTRDAQVGRQPRYALLPSAVIAPGADLSHFRPDDQARARRRAELGWPDDAFVAGFVGRFVPEKGIETLLDALGGLTGEWRLLCVGGGPQRHVIDSFSRRHAGRVHVVTDARHGDVASWMNAMDVLCAPSRTTPRWREQFGRMLVEAMACGVPVAGSDSGEIPHVIGDAGMVVPEGDARAWRGAIVRLATSAPVRADLAARGLARARAEFSWRGAAERHLEFFETLA